MKETRKGDKEQASVSERERERGLRREDKRGRGTDTPAKQRGASKVHYASHNGNAS